MSTKIGLAFTVNSRWDIAIQNGYSIGIVNAAKGIMGSYAGFLNTKDIYYMLGVGYRINKPVFRTSGK